MRAPDALQNDSGGNSNPDQASVPEWEAFRDAPIETVASVSPLSMLYAPGGTRRQAILQGVEPWSGEFFHAARRQAIESFDLLFRHGVRHLFAPAFLPGNFKEENRFSDRVLEAVDWGIAGPEALEDYRRHGWKVRLIGSHHSPFLHETAARVQEKTARAVGPTLWWTVVSDSDLDWAHLFTSLKQHPVKSRAEAVRLLYGEDIPPISLYLAFGKPMVGPALLPPLLTGEVQCYWSQKVGYSLTEEDWRAIVYDYVYLRRTWRVDKLERAAEALHRRSLWTQGPIIGLGQAVGSFWFPRSVQNQEIPDDDSGI